MTISTGTDLAIITVLLLVGGLSLYKLIELLVYGERCPDCGERTVRPKVEHWEGPTVMVCRSCGWRKP